MYDRAPTKEIDGQTVLDNESGNKFFHRHLSSKARKMKRTKRKKARTSRRKNR